MTAAGSQVYRLLPDYIRAADTAGQLAAFVDAAATGINPALAFLNQADPDTSVTGTCEIANPNAVARALLGWLGWLVGIDTTQVADRYVRSVVAAAASSQRRGSIAAIHNAVARTLTGSQYARIYTNISGTDPYHITVITMTSETPSASATLLAATNEKPAGMTIELQTVNGSTWSLVQANYATWNAVGAAHPTWNDLMTWLP